MSIDANTIKSGPHTLPVAQGPILQQCIDTYGKQPQVDMAIEEMSELTKALLKERRALHRDDPEAWYQAIMNIADEMAVSIASNAKSETTLTPTFSIRRSCRSG